MGVNLRQLGPLMRFCGLLLALSLFSPPASAEEAHEPAATALEIHLDLTRQFYDALGHTERAQRHSLSTNHSERYLEQIAISTRFMVETNLRLLKEQAEIKALLQELMKDSKQ